MLGNSIWRAGMQTLHAPPFNRLALARDPDPFFDRDIPSDLEGQAAYAQAARVVEARWQQEATRSLLRLARR